VAKKQQPIYAALLYIVEIQQCEGWDKAFCCKASCPHPSCLHFNGD
jgi:hypothetical protein